MAFKEPRIRIKGGMNGHLERRRYTAMDHQQNLSLYIPGPSTTLRLAVQPKPAARFTEPFVRPFPSNLDCRGKTFDKTTICSRSSTSKTPSTATPREVAQQSPLQISSNPPTPPTATTRPWLPRGHQCVCRHPCHSHRWARSSEVLYKIRGQNHGSHVS